MSVEQTLEIGYKQPTDYQQAQNLGRLAVDQAKDQMNLDIAEEVYSPRVTGGTMGESTPEYLEDLHLGIFDKKRKVILNKCA